MPKRSRRTFSPEFKAKVVLEVLSGLRSPAEACKQYSLKPDLLARWKAIALQRFATLFADDEPPRSQEQARIAELERLVGRQTLELEILKKASTLLAGTPGSNGRSL